ncbi:MAG: hypothetical protein EXS46_02205 [Candidatus Taylorbacteria bacterium]|nr:hypothetical protein [Candidatus Taylorbacteria bacterium]
MSVTATRGLKGMVKADLMLKKRGEVGLLIGGLAEAVWNQKRTPRELTKRKDVDVLVAKTLKSPIVDFAGGIDWWQPITVHFDRLLTSDVASVENIDRTFWVNGNGTALTYRAELNQQLRPGLHVPSKNFALAIRITEMFASVHDSISMISEDEELFRERLARRLGMGSCLPSFVKKLFSEKPVDHGELAAFALSPVNLKEQAALNKKGQYYSKKKK